MLILNDEYWNNTIINPNTEAPISRKVLWSMWNVINSTPFEQRDEHWEYASSQLKRVLITGDKR